MCFTSGIRPWNPRLKARAPKFVSQGLLSCLPAEEAEPLLSFGLGP